MEALEQTYFLALRELRLAMTVLKEETKYSNPKVNMKTFRNGKAKAILDDFEDLTAKDAEVLYKKLSSIEV